MLIRKMDIGRSPTVVATYLVWTGLSVNEAIEKVVASGSLIAKLVVSRYTLDKFLSYSQETQRLRSDANNSFEHTTVSPLQGMRALLAMF
jgi:hypothetical protein